MALKKADLETLSEIRLAEAQVLFAAGHFSGAYYLAGYALECLLKAIVAGTFRADEIPDKEYVNRIYTHRFEVLLGLTNLKQLFDHAEANSKRFQAHWKFVLRWESQVRYKVVEEKDAANLLAALTDEEEGIVPWFRKFL